MRSLERARLRAGSEHGLIIPVVLRGFDDLPAEIRQNRQVYRFERYSVSGPRLIRNRSFDADIQKMAAYIAERVREMRDDAFDCGEFRMPGDDDVNDLVMTGGAVAFPGREKPS
jgi:hypothetical protein